MKVKCYLCKYHNESFFCGIRKNVRKKILPNKSRICSYYMLDDTKLFKEQNKVKPISTLRPFWFHMTRSEKNKLTLRQTKGQLV